MSAKVAATSTVAYGTGVTGDAASERIQILGNGAINVGDGATAPGATNQWAVDFSTGFRLRSNQNITLTATNGYAVSINGGVQIGALHAAVIPLDITGVASTSVDLLRVRDSGAATAFRVTKDKSVVVGVSAPATGATDGFLYLPITTGSPSGTPSAITGYAPCLLDSGASKLWAYIGGAWKAVALT